MAYAIKILGADNYATNKSGNNYVPTLQVTTNQRSKLHKLIVSNLTGTDIYLWVFDVVTGAASTANPRMVCMCPGSVCTTLDLSSGSPFTKGIYLTLSSTVPTDATTAATAVANNAAIVECDYRLET